MSARRHRTAVLAVMSVLALAAGCKRPSPARDAGAAQPVAASEPSVKPLTSAQHAPGPERIVLGQVAVHTVDPEVPREIYPRQLAQNLGLALADSGLFVPEPAQVPPGELARPASIELTVRYDLVDQGSTGEPAVMAAVEARVLWDDAPASPAASRSAGPAPAESITTERPVRPGEDLDGLMAVHVAETVKLVGTGLVAKERVRAGGAQAVAAVLTDVNADDDMVCWALELAAAWRLANLFDQVASRLEASHPLVRERAVVALAALGDPRAVPLLTRHARFDDHAALAVVIDTVVALGGDEARAYLEFVASGHPDASLRERAAQGLTRLRGQPP